MKEEAASFRTIRAAHEQPWLRDDDSANDGAHLLLPNIVQVLLRRFPRVDPGLANDAAVDVILKHLHAPSVFDPGRASLQTYLTFFAANRLRDLLRREMCRRNAELEFALATWRGSRGRTGMNGLSLDLDRFAERVCRSPLEREFLYWWLEGRSGDELLGLLGVFNQPRPVQRRCLNRVKGRLLHRIRRLRGLLKSDVDRARYFDAAGPRTYI